MEEQMLPQQIAHSYGVTERGEVVPGLNKALTVEDLEESRKM